MRLIGNDVCSRYPAVTSDMLFLRTGEPHPDGIFSTTIFGSSPAERAEKFAVIHFNTELVHPEIWILLRRVFRDKVKAILQLKPYIIENGEIKLLDESDLKDYPNYNIGLTALIDKLLELKLPDTIFGNTLKKIIDAFPDVKISCILVIPPAYREIKDEFNLDPLNKAYVNLIKYSRNIISIKKDPKDEKYGRFINLMQLQIETIYNAITEKLGKKFGAIRSYLLGKRLDFTGRAVITTDPEIPIDHLGIPVRMAVKLFEPWLIRNLTLQVGLTIDEALELINRISAGYVKPGSEDYDVVKEILEQIIENRVVLAKRDPALHRLSWQAFRVVLVDDNTIHLNPLHTVSYNADHDGDQMAVFVPFTKEGIVTAEKLLNPYAPANPRRLKYDFNKDYKYGVCIMTSDPPSEEYSKKYWWWKQTTLNIQGSKYLTTEGRKYIADLIPQDILNNPNIINPEIFQSKINIDKLATLLLEHNVDVEIVKNMLDKVQKKVLEVMTIFSKALSMIDLTLTEKIKPLVNELDENDPIDVTQKKLDKINKRLKELILSDSEDLSHMLKCGVLKFGQMVQLLAVKGLILSPNGEVILVKENFAEGLDAEKYFEAGHGARMGIVSRAQKTAITGYLQRQMVYAAASVELDPDLDDCGTGKTVDMLVTEDLSHRIINRYIILDGKKVLVTPELAKELIGKRIHLRSPIFCISKKVCRTCYGEDYKLINTTKIGFVAAESLGERFSQEMMKAFHTGGVVSFKFLNPIKESVDTLGIDEKKYNQILEYDDKEKILKAKEDLLFILEKEYYNLNAFLRKVEVSEGIELETILADIQSEKLGETIPFVYDSSVFLYVPTDITLHNKEKYILKYEKGDKIFKALPVTSDVETKAKKVLAVFQGKGTFKDVSHLVTKVYKELQSFGDIILVHIEVLISQLLRCPDDPRYPYRLCKDFSKPPKLYGIKKIPYLESWKRGLEFENITNAIANALTNPEITQESLLDELL